MGVTMAFFNTCGNIPSQKELLTKTDSGGAKLFATSLKTFVGTLLSP